MKLLSCITLSLYLIGSSLSGQNTAASLTSNGEDGIRTYDLLTASKVF
jgi:hypothetical protein